MDQEKVGRLLKTLRKAKGMTQRELSEMCSFSFGIEEIGIRKGIEQGAEEGTFKTLLRLVVNGKITTLDAAETAGMGVDALLEKKAEYERSGE